jgi:tellurite resistance protein TerC
MNVPGWVWALTIVGIVGLLVSDYFFHVRKAHVPTLREAAIWSSVYVGLAIAFGIAVLIFGGVEMGAEYFAGYVTEKALSVDNLFVFLVIFTSFAVPREDQQKALLFGITFSLVARTALVFLGSAAINAFSWVFYAFGLILLITAGNMLKPRGGDRESADNIMVRTAKKLVHTTDRYDGDKLFTVQNGQRAMTPMLLVMVALAGTDLLFALDSIPAIFGLTQNVYLVFTAIAFSLLGLRQLYFLIDGLLDRLIYLAYGLAAVLGFIGVKLILPKGKAQTAIANARRHAAAYLNSEYTARPGRTRTDLPAPARRAGPDHPPGPAVPGDGEARTRPHEPGGPRPSQPRCSRSTRRSNRRHLASATRTVQLTPCHHRHGCGVRRQLRNDRHHPSPGAQSVVVLVSNSVNSRRSSAWPSAPRTRSIRRSMPWMVAMPAAMQSWPRGVSMISLARRSVGSGCRST